MSTKSRKRRRATKRVTSPRAIGRARGRDRPPKEIFGDLLRGWREDAGLDHEDLADSIGIDADKNETPRRNVVQQWEQGRVSRLRKSDLDAIDKACGLRRRGTAFDAWFEYVLPTLCRDPALHQELSRRIKKKAAAPINEELAEEIRASLEDVRGAVTANGADEIVHHLEQIKSILLATQGGVWEHNILLNLQAVVRDEALTVGITEDEAVEAMTKGLSELLTADRQVHRRRPGAGLRQLIRVAPYLEAGVLERLVTALSAVVDAVCFQGHIDVHNPGGVRHIALRSEGTD